MAGASDLGDGIAQIRLPMAGNPLRYINGYVLEDDGGLTLVDCGWKADDVLAALHAGLHELGYELADVRRDRDHAPSLRPLRPRGNAAPRRRARTAHARARLGDRASISRRRTTRTIAPANAWLERNGFVPGDSATRASPAAGRSCEPTQLVADGERVGRLEAIWTPGHSPGHLCFADTRSGRMLTGDHVLDPITPHVGLWRGRDGDPMGDYLASLEKVRGRGPAGALPAHGEPFADLDRRVDELIAHTRAREAQVLAALGSRRRPAPATSPGGCRGRAAIARSTSLGQWHQQFAVSETIAHLQHLFVDRRAIAPTLRTRPDPIRYSFKPHEAPEEQQSRRLMRRR